MKYLLNLQIVVEAENVKEAVANYEKGEVVSLKLDKRSGSQPSNDHKPVAPLMRRPHTRPRLT